MTGHAHPVRAGTPVPRAGGVPVGLTAGLMVGLVVGVAADTVVGDPRRGHPVAAFGRLAAAVERRLWADSVSRGALHAGLCVAAATAAGACATAAATRLGRLRGQVGETVALAAVTAAATWAAVGAQTLVRTANAMADALDRGDLDQARQRLPELCGRDPSGLGATELARATVESVAENTSDAVIGPIVWGAAAGVPGLLGYRAVNTLDAMVGHRSPRYRRFGWAAARVDDAAGLVPARLTALLSAACAPVVGGSVAATLRVWWRDRRCHPSPNAGQCEAAAAGALGVRLGGVNVYGGRAEHRPEMGEGRAPEPADIRRAARLSRAVGLGGLGLAVAGVAVGTWTRAGAGAVVGGTG